MKRSNNEFIHRQMGDDEADRIIFDIFDKHKKVISKNNS